MKRGFLNSLCLALVAFCGLPAPVAAQTDYYNTDRGRPLSVEDAYPVERRGFEVQAAPLRLERLPGGRYRWSVEPDLAYGVLPRTQIELGVPLVYMDAAAGERRSGIAGLDLSLLHNLNAETAIPAFAVAATALLPVGSLAADDPYLSLKGILTRTLTWARFHVNGEYTLGAQPPAGSDALEDVGRWMAGLSVDRALPLRSVLFAGELVVQQPLDRDAHEQVGAAVGIRYQRSPRWAIDGGIGRRFTGNDQAWFATFGSAYAFGLPWHPRGR